MVKWDEVLNKLSSNYREATHIKQESRKRSYMSEDGGDQSDTSSRRSYSDYETSKRYGKEARQDSAYIKQEGSYPSYYQ